MAKYKCSVCGWIYDTEVSNPHGAIAAGKPFEKISDDWRYPICGAAKSDFEKTYSGSTLPR